MMINWIIITILMVLTVFNVYYLFYLKSKSIKDGAINEKDNYYKLDAKIELFKYLTLGLISIAALFGISKFSDISSQFKDFENLDNNYEHLLEDYNKLKTDNHELALKMVEMKELFTEYEVIKKDLEIEYVKQNYRIKEATKKIPDHNVRILTKKLVESYIRGLTMEGMLMDGPDRDLIMEEMENMEYILKIAGYPPDEIKTILDKVKTNAPWVFKEIN